jgi:hypothetical protein
MKKRQEQIGDIKLSPDDFKRISDRVKELGKVFGFDRMNLPETCDDLAQTKSCSIKFSYSRLS